MQVNVNMMRQVPLIGAYVVHAQPWEHGLELHVKGLGVTQCLGWDDAEAVVRDYIAAVTGQDPDSFAFAIIRDSAYAPATG